MSAPLQNPTVDHAPVVLDAISKIYRPDHPELSVKAIDALSFRVERGEALAIIGPSGCGKSSLLHILGCLDRPTHGRYLLEGRDVSRLSEDERARVRNRHIGFVFQAFNLLPRMSALENVELPLLYAATTNTREKAMHALDRVGLADRADHRPNELSGGQKQRVAIARALVTEPSIVLGDEPTGALDSVTSGEVLDLMDRLHAEGTTLILVTHDLNVARRVPRVIRMHDGHIVGDGASAQIVDELLRESAEGLDARP